jgi:hypothetical protein
MRSMVGGKRPLKQSDIAIPRGRGDYPSTTLRVVPLPMLRMGRIKRVSAALRLR